VGVVGVELSSLEDELWDDGGCRAKIVDPVGGREVSLISFTGAMDHSMVMLRAGGGDVVEDVSFDMIDGQTS